MAYYQGDTLPFVITVQENGTDVTSLSGCTLSVKLFQRGNPTAIASKTQADCTVGTATYTGSFTAANTASCLGDYVIEAQVTDGSLRVKTAQVKIKIEADLI